MQKEAILNKEQIEACEHDEGPLVVLAGAGSGKTKVVVSRIAHLMKKGVHPSEILAVTFTNKAAGELKERLQKQNLAAPLTVTFHALGVRILRESIHTFGYGNDFVIFDSSDSESLIRDILLELTGKKDKKLTKDIKRLISSAKSKLLLPGDRVGEEFTFDTEGQKTLFIETYRLYQERLKISNAVDFDDLIMLTVFILQDRELKEKYASRWKYILVDEYQDTNHAQYLICKALCAKHKNLFVVGDPDQSIYSFRGAKISNILNFEKDFPGAKVIPLQQNYRSTTHILSAANAVIEKNNRLYEKKLFSEMGEGEKVELHPFSNGFEEVRFVVRKIEQFIRKGENPSEIVIFYRTNSQSRMFEDGLIEHGIAYQIIGGLSFYQRKEIKDILGFMRLLASPSDFVSFTRIINLPKRGLGKKTIEKIIAACMAAEISVIDLCRRLVIGDGSFKLTAKALAGVTEFIQFYDKMHCLIEEGISLADLITEVLSKSGYSKVLAEEKDSMQDRIENIDELVSKADDYDKRHGGSLIQFLEDVCLDTSNSGDEDLSDKVSLMTIHNAKGLEFDVCFVVGLEEDVFPHVRAKGSIEEIEEERRLFYVGMTRAKRHLHLTYAKRRFLWGSEKILRESRFIKELPKEHVLGMLETARVSPAASSSSAEDDISVGSYVLHRTFGKGVVDRVYETSYGLTYDVLFARDSQKRTLIAKFAKLSSLHSS